jgi:hypothetical protein
MSNPEKVVMSSEPLSHEQVKQLWQKHWRDDAGVQEAIIAFANEAYAMGQASRSALGDETAKCARCNDTGEIAWYPDDAPCPDCKGRLKPAVKDALPGAEVCPSCKGKRKLYYLDGLLNKSVECGECKGKGAVIIQAPAVPAGEPVAWRCRSTPNHMWNYLERPVQLVGFEQQPLFTRPSGAVPVAAIQTAITAMIVLASQCETDICNAINDEQKTYAEGRYNTAMGAAKDLEQFIAGKPVDNSLKIPMVPIRILEVALKAMQSLPTDRNPIAAAKLADYTNQLKTIIERNR